MSKEARKGLMGDTNLVQLDASGLDGLIEESLASVEIDSGDGEEDKPVSGDLP